MLALRVARLARARREKTGDLVTRSYDRIAPGYDAAWTEHMRDLSLAMLDRLGPPTGGRCVDLACGTGFVTARLAELTSRPPVGVDASACMLAEARVNYGRQCEFIQADALDFLRRQPDDSADAITCAWALGYTRPLAVIRQAARVLRPGGRLGIIDNTLFSLAGVLRAAMATFAERPEALVHLVRFRFLPHSSAAAALMRLAGLRVRHCTGGARSYVCPDGAAAVARLRATGAAAGFEFAAAPDCEAEIFARFAEVIEGLYGTADGVGITHRYLVCIGEKP